MSLIGEAAYFLAVLSQNVALANGSPKYCSEIRETLSQNRSLKNVDLQHAPAVKMNLMASLLTRIDQGRDSI